MNEPLDLSKRAREIEANARQMKETRNWLLRIGAIALRAVFLAAAGGNVICKDAALRILAIMDGKDAALMDGDEWKPENAAAVANTPTRPAAPHFKTQ